MSDTGTAIGRLLDLFADAVERQRKANPPAPSGSPTDWEAKNHHDHIVLFLGEEPVAKVRPEDAHDIYVELVTALEKRRGEYAE